MAATNSPGGPLRGGTIYSMTGLLVNGYDPWCQAHYSTALSTKVNWRRNLHVYL